MPSTNMDFEAGSPPPGTIEMFSIDGNTERPASPCHTDDNDGTKPEQLVRGFKRAVVMVSLLSSLFLLSLDNTVMANVRPSIVETFHRIDFLPWLTVSYPLGELGANPIWGKLYKLFNNKILYLAALFIFEVGSAVIGSAQATEVVVFGRALAGLGGSGIYVGTVNIVTALTTPVERTHYLNFVGVAWCLGTILGPIVGGAFADSSITWRWAFYINVIVAAVAAPTCVMLIPPILPPGSCSTVANRLKRIDYLGAILFLGAVDSTIMILSFGGSIYAWDDRRMVTLYVVTGVTWIAFSLQQYFSFLTVDRIFPVQFIRSWEMVVMFVWSSISLSSILVTIFSLPLFYQFVHAESALKSGVYTIPFIAAIVVSIGTTGPIFAKFPYYMAWFAGASILMLIGNALLSTIHYTTSFGAIAGYTIIGGLGVATVVQLGFTVAQVKVAPSSVPEVSQFLSCAQMAGLALSLGISTLVFLNRATEDIAVILPNLPRHEIMAAIDSANTALLDNLDSETVLRIRDTIARTVGQVFYLNVAGAALGLLLALTMKREKLDLTPDTREIPRQRSRQSKHIKGAPFEKL
ncbi:MFS general substrate transporter [Xylaria venustula]|nr:MFS general substrate transporter [Xylaria venustula]